MKYFVRVISAFILLIYTLEGLFFAGLSGWGMIKSIPEVPNVGGGTIDGSPTPILDGIGKFFSYPHDRFFTHRGPCKFGRCIFDDEKLHYGHQNRHFQVLQFLFFDSFDL